jgi:hypothetical protein
MQATTQDAATITLRGRTFSAQELRTIKAIVDAAPAEHRFELSKRVCRELGWRQPNGRLEDRVPSADVHDRVAAAA